MHIQETQRQRRSCIAKKAGRAQEGTRLSETGFRPEVEPGDGARMEFSDGSGVRVPAALTEDLSVVLSTRIRQFSSEPPGTPAPGDLIPSSSLCLQVPALMHIATACW